MRRIFKVISLIFLPAVIWIFVNATIDRHTHYTYGGFYLTHAHPYDKTSNDSDTGRSHHHSDNEFLLLNFFADPLATVILGFFFSFFLYAFTLFLTQIQNYPQPLRQFYQILNYHAPPEQ